MSTQDTTRDQVVPGPKWAFDEKVTKAFDDMLERSIPDYRSMRSNVLEIGSIYAERLEKNVYEGRTPPYILDLGSSRGEALRSFAERFGGRFGYCGVEISKPMANAARQNFANLKVDQLNHLVATAPGRYLSPAEVEIDELDLRREYPHVGAAVTLAILTLQFVPIEHRQKLLRRIYDHTFPGGVVIVVEKVLGATHEIDDTLVNLYWKMKANNGYSQDDIQRKALSLEGVLVPVTADWNVSMIEKAGFTQVDCFYRSLNFAGWFGVK